MSFKEYYDAKAEYEWNRLFQDAYHQLEFIVHMHFLEKYLPKKGLILEQAADRDGIQSNLPKESTKLCF